MAQKIQASIELTNAQFLRSAQQVQQATQSMRRGMDFGKLGGQLGGFLSVGLVTAGFKSLVSEGDKIGDLASRFGISADALQRIGNAASLMEGDIDSVAAAFNKLTIAQAKAAAGETGVTEALTKLRVDARQFVNLSTEDAFYRLADAVKTADDRAGAYQAVIAILGRNAGNLFTTLEQGSDTIRETGDAMGRFSQDTLDQFDMIDKSFKKLASNMKEQWGNMTLFLIRSMESVGLGLSNAWDQVQFGLGNLDADQLARRQNIGAEMMNDIWNPAKNPDAAKPRAPLDIESDADKKKADKELDQQRRRDEFFADFTDEQAKLMAHARGDTEAESRADRALRMRKLERQMLDLGFEASSAEDMARRRVDAEDAAKKDDRASRMEVDSLHAIGGGGSAGAAIDPATRELTKQTPLLKEIKDGILRLDPRGLPSVRLSFS